MSLPTTESGSDGEISLITQYIQINFQVLELTRRNCATTCSLPTCTCMEMGMSCNDVCRAQNCGNENDSGEELLGNDDEINYADWLSSEDEDND